MVADGVVTIDIGLFLLCEKRRISARRLAQCVRLRAVACFGLKCRVCVRDSVVKLIAIIRPCGLGFSPCALCWHWGYVP